jgi:hypothetical protein
VEKLSLQLSMRRIVFVLTLALVALLLCFVIFAASRSPQTVDYCDVARNGAGYHNRVIRVKATLFLSSGAVYIYEDCDPVEALAALVELDGEGETDTRGYVEQLLVHRSESSLKKVDAIIEGRFNAEFSNGCWGPKYQIAASKVELLSPVSDYIPPQVGEEGLRMKH